MTANANRDTGAFSIFIFISKLQTISRVFSRITAKQVCMQTHKRSWVAWPTLVLWLVPLVAATGAQAGQPALQRDIEYARVGEHSLKLDLYSPPNVENPALIVWVHGGAWRSGSKSSMPLSSLVARGFAIASVDYRLTPVAPFPAQVHDMKAAIRFLRAKAGDCGFDGRRFAVAGASAGGHLAALVGVTNGDKLLQGTVGDYTGASSDVQAIVSFYGMSNLTTILSQSTPHGLKVRVPALELLLGGQPEQKPDLARLASPVLHVDARDPPLLLLHGDQDPQAPINQSHELQGAYEDAGLTAEFVVVHGAAHGGDKFFDEAHMKIVADFLDRSLPK
jgi:acetyl esterase/lipase